MKKILLAELSIELINKNSNPIIQCGHNIGIRLTYDPESSLYDLYVERPATLSIGSGQLIDDDDSEDNDNDNNDDSNSSNSSSPLDLTEMVKSELLDIAEMCEDQSKLLAIKANELRSLIKTVKVDRPDRSKIASHGKLSSQSPAPVHRPRLASPSPSSSSSQSSPSSSLRQSRKDDIAIDLDDLDNLD